MMPTTAIQRHDLSLTMQEFGITANQAKFIGLRVFPPVSVNEQSSSFDILKVRSLLTPLETTERAPDGSYRRSKGEYQTLTYATADHGAEEEVSDRRAKMYGQARAERVAAIRASNRTLQRLEKTIADAAFNTTTITNVAVSAGAWGVANSDPVGDVQAGIERVILQCGTEPNLMVITDNVFRALQNNAQILDRLKYWGGDDPKQVTRQALAAIFDVDRLEVAAGMLITGDETATSVTPTFARHWNSTIAGLYSVNTTPDVEAEMANIGRTFMWTQENAPIPGGDAGYPAVIMEEYREERKRAGIMRARCDYDVKEIYPAAATLITGVS